MDKCYVWKSFFINHITDVEDLEYICIGEGGGGRGQHGVKKLLGIQVAKIITSLILKTNILYYIIIIGLFCDPVMSLPMWDVVS